MKRRFITLYLLILILLVFVGCNLDNKVVDKGVDNDKKLQVITTLFPQYDFAKRVGQDRVEVKLLISPGVEAHSYDPSPKDMVNIENADLFIYTGEYMEPWAVKISENIKSKKLVIIDSSKGIELMDGEDHEEEDDHEHSHGSKDPHIWTDPIYAQLMVDNIVDGLIKSDPEHSDYYIDNASNYKDELQELHEKIQTTLEKTRSKKIVYGGHFAFGYFVDRYGLEYTSPYGGFSPNAEPSPQKILELIRDIEDAGTKTIYYEELIQPKIAQVLSKETGAKILLLHGAHNISKDELKANIGYIDIMEGNLERLKEGLGYDE